jgi:hypothetical protein
MLRFRIIAREQRQPIAKRGKQEIAEDLAQSYENIAKTRGITLEQFFRENPDEYRDYCRMSAVSVGAKVY